MRLYQAWDDEAGRDVACRTLGEARQIARRTASSGGACAVLVKAGIPSRACEAVNAFLGPEGWRTVEEWQCGDRLIRKAGRDGDDTYNTVKVEW